jgi:hypothetical protein
MLAFFLPNSHSRGTTALPATLRWSQGKVLGRSGALVIV